MRVRIFQIRKYLPPGDLEGKKLSRKSIYLVAGRSAGY